MNILVSLDTYKALTERLRYEGHSYDDVIRELLGLDSPLSPDPEGSFTPEWIDSDGKDYYKHLGCFYSRNLVLPNGTRLRARYKGREYQARIADGAWLDEKGAEHGSPSAAARKITGNNVNGLRFWECSRPGDSFWRRLEAVAGEEP